MSEKPNLLAHILKTVADKDEPQSIRIFGQNQLHKVIDGEPIDDLSDIKPKKFKEDKDNG